MKRNTNYSQVTKALESLKIKLSEMKEDQDLAVIEKELQEVFLETPIEKFTKKKPEKTLPKVNNNNTKELTKEDIDIEELQNDIEGIIDNEEGDAEESGKKTAIGGKKKTGKKVKSSADTEGEKITTPSMNPQKGK